MSKDAENILEAYRQGKLSVISVDGYRLSQAEGIVTIYRQGKLSVFSVDGFGMRIWLESKFLIQMKTKLMLLIR